MMQFLGFAMLGPARRCESLRWVRACEIRSGDSIPGPTPRSKGRGVFSISISWLTRNAADDKIRAVEQHTNHAKGFAMNEMKRKLTGLIARLNEMARSLDNAIVGENTVVRVTGGLYLSLDRSTYPNGLRLVPLDRADCWNAEAAGVVAACTENGAGDVGVAVPLRVAIREEIENYTKFLGVISGNRGAA